MISHWLIVLKHEMPSQILIKNSWIGLVNVVHLCTPGWVGVRAVAGVTFFFMTRTSGLAQFGLEFLLAFMLVLTYLRVTDTQPGDQTQVGR